MRGHVEFELPYGPHFGPPDFGRHQGMPWDHCGDHSGYHFGPPGFGNHPGHHFGPSGFGNHSGHSGHGPHHRPGHRGFDCSPPRHGHEENHGPDRHRPHHRPGGHRGFDCSPPRHGNEDNHGPDRHRPHHSPDRHCHRGDHHGHHDDTPHDRRHHGPRNCSQDFCNHGPPGYDQSFGSPDWGRRPFDFPGPRRCPFPGFGPIRGRHLGPWSRPEPFGRPCSPCGRRFERPERCCNPEDGRDKPGCCRRDNQNENCCSKNDRRKGGKENRSYNKGNKDQNANGDTVLVQRIVVERVPRPQSV